MEASAIQSNIGPGIKYGLGLMISHFGGKMFIGHHGGVPGFVADDQIIPSDRFALVVLSNNYTFSTAQITGDVLREFYPSFSRTATTNPTAPSRDHKTLNAALLQRFADFVRGLGSHQIQRALLAPAMLQALDPKTFDELCATVGSFGELQSLEYLSESKVGDLTSYHFSGHFEKQTVPLTFFVTSDNFLAGFSFT